MKHRILHLMSYILDLLANNSSPVTEDEILDHRSEVSDHLACFS